MTTIEKTAPDDGLNALLSECFSGGEILRRELRLTAAQARYVAETYPASLRPMGGGWYEITFQEVYCHGS